MIVGVQLAKVQAYIDDVLSGDIVACKLIKAAVERHVKDLERAENDPTFPYHFDANAAECACAYFPIALRHSIGDYAGMPFELEPWQAFGVAVLLGWKRDVDGTRRFRRAYWSMGRKNGKSTTGGGLALQLAQCDINPNTGQPEKVADVILCATKIEQIAKVMFAEIQRMRLQSPPIKAVSECKNKVVRFFSNDGTIRCVGSDKPYSGLNPSVVVKDELHEFVEFHRKFLETMDTGGGSRCQPLDIVFTTAGDTSSLIWLEVYGYFRRVVLGEITDESCFCYCFEIDEDDDPLDEAVWPKANPNIGVSIKLSYLRDQAIKAKDSPVALNTFTRFHGNRVVSSTERAFDLDAWDACAGELSDWTTADACGGGVDLGSRDDFAAWGLVARFPVEGTEDDEIPTWRYEIKSAAYIALNTKRDLTKQPFAEWCHLDLIKRSLRPISDLRDDLLDQCRAYYVHDVAYDPYNGQQFSEEMEEEGVAIASMAQTCAMFHEPIQDFRQALLDGRVRHDGNPLLRWCIGNANVIRDRQDRWMFCKRDSSEKIDPAVAMVMAYRRAMVAPASGSGNLFVTG